jgi:hypothetical protein
MKFIEIIEQLKSCCDAKIIKSESETDYRFLITNSLGIDYWISISKDDEEIIIGFCSIHTHFGKRYGENYEMKDNIDFLKKILSSEIIAKDYFCRNESLQNRI